MRFFFNFNNSPKPYLLTLKILIVNSKYYYFYFILLLFMFSAVLQAQQLKTFSTIPERTASNQYTSRVREVGSPTWQDEFVIQTTCKPKVLADGVTDSGYFGNLNGWSASYIAIEFANTSVEVEISKADGTPITKAVVRPAGYATVTLSGGKAIVTLTKNVNINVDINGQMEDNYTGGGYSGPPVHTFCIFANPVYNPPSAGKVITLQPNQDIRALNRADWDAIIFAPGVHNIGTQFEIMSNEILYIPGDAIVHGTIRPNQSSRWKIYGTGALSSEHLNWRGDDAVENKSFTNSATGLTVEGFVVIDPANHTFNMYNSGNEKNIYKNLKIFGWKKNSDGVNAFRNSEISDCFFRVQDDVFYLGNNVKIHDITTWTDSNGAVMFLTSSDKDSYFKDIKVIYNRKMWHGWNSGVISMRETSGNIENVICQNIDVEDPLPTVGLFHGRISTTEEPVNGCVFNNINFDNITQLAPRRDGNKTVFTGTAKSIWKNITINNCKYQGQYLTSIDSNWSVNQYVEVPNPASITAIKFLTNSANSFTITASASTNGSISPSGSVQYDKYTHPKYYITPNSGYQVESVTVDGINLGAISSYTFNYIIENHTISATFKRNPFNAFSKIEAENYSSMVGVQVEPCNEGGQQLGAIENNDYIVFNDVDFGSGPISLDVRVASGSVSGTIEIRLDGITGPIIGSCQITNTGDFQTWMTKNCAIIGATGMHNLYLKFTGGDGNLFNLNWIKFKGVDVPNVTELSGWVSGTTNPKALGSDRLLVVMVMGESTAAFSATGVTYGGQAMTKQTDKLEGTGFRTYASIFTLNEAGVNDAAASGSIDVTFDGTVPTAGNFDVYSILLGNVDQTTLVSTPLTAGLTGVTIETAALPSASGDMILFSGATAGNNTATTDNGFAKVFESSKGWGDGVGGSKLSTGVEETPKFTQSASGRMTLCALVVKKVADESLSVENNQLWSATVKVYPNPVANILNIHSEGSSEKVIQVFNALGQLVFSTNSTSANTQINIQSLNLSGFVIVQVIAEGKVSNHKVIIKA